METKNYTDELIEISNDQYGMIAVQVPKLPDQDRYITELGEIAKLYKRKKDFINKVVGERDETPEAEAFKSIGMEEYFDMLHELKRRFTIHKLKIKNKIMGKT